MIISLTFYFRPWMCHHIFENRFQFHSQYLVIFSHIFIQFTNSFHIIRYSNNGKMILIFFIEGSDPLIDGNRTGTQPPMIKKKIFTSGIVRSDPFPVSSSDRE